MKRTTILQVLLALGVVLIPAVITTFFVYVYERATLTAFVPHYFPLDDLYYWRQIRTFSAAGLNGGYYVPDELTAPASFSHFGAHGPLFPMIYGTLARLIGWQPYSPPIANLIVLALALGGLIVALRLNAKQLVCAGFLVGTAWPVTFYVLSGMQESLHQAIAIVLVILFYGAITRRAALSRRVQVFFLLFLFFAGLLRLTWVFWAFPFFMLTSPHITRRAVILALVKTAVLVLVVIALTFGYLYAPYHANFISELQTSVLDDLRSDGPLAALETGVNLLGRNMRDNVSFFNQGTRLEISQRYQFLFLIAACAGWLTVVLRRAKQGRPNDTATTLPEAGFHVFNLALILLVNFVLYTMAGWRDYRVLAPHLLLTGLLMVAFSRFRLAALVILVNLAAVIPFKDYYLAYGATYLSYDHDRIARFETATKDYLVYDPAESSAWCNTLLINHHRSYAPELIAVPPEMGISYFVVPDILDMPLKSRYVILKEPDYAVLQARVSLQRLTATALGDLYLNLDARCGHDSVGTAEGHTP